MALLFAVNLSAHSLHDMNLPNHIAAILKAANLPATYLSIELTESAMMSDLARAMDIFERLSAMGIRLSIDDFGTGLSSLSYLKRLPINDLEIDKPEFNLKVQHPEAKGNRATMRGLCCRS